MAVPAAGRQVLIPFVHADLPTRGYGCAQRLRVDVAGRTAGPVGGMKFHVLTIFRSFLWVRSTHGVVAKAQQAGRLEIQVHDLRHWTYDRHRTVDDRPFGGGEGMLLKPQPLFEAVEAILPERTLPKNSVLLSAQGAMFSAAYGGGILRSRKSCSDLRPV